MPNQETLYAVKDRIATITFNRPDKLNAWTAVMDDEVRASINQAEQDDDVRVIVLTGAGRGFCAGADMALLGNIVENGVGDQESRMLRGQTNGSSRPGVRADFQRKYSYFPSIQKPVIAAINGPAVGLGFILAMYCDLRFAADNAKFGTHHRSFPCARSAVERPHYRFAGSSKNGRGESGLPTRSIPGQRKCVCA
jgi:enoyl-CoA hydratase/carnithine racemase